MRNKHKISSDNPINPLTPAEAELYGESINEFNDEPEFDPDFDSDSDFDSDRFEEYEELYEKER